MTYSERRRIQVVVLSLFLAVCLLPVLEAAKDISVRVDTILARYPASSISDRDLLSREILDLGPKALDNVISRLQEPFIGPAVAAEYALSGLAHTVTRPGAEKERRAFIQALHRALRKPGPVEARSFLISQILLAGGVESVKVLASFLADDRLRDPAVRALVSIGDSRAETALLRAVEKVPGVARIDLLNGLAEMPVRNAEKRLLALAVNPDPDIRSAARHALAASGDPRALDVIGRVSLTAPASERDFAPSLYLRYAERLAENGRHELSLKIARKILTAYTTPRESRVRCAALSLVASTLGDAVLPDLLEAARDPDPQFRGQALRLAADIRGEEATQAWISLMKESSAEIRAGIIAMLGERGDLIAFPPVLKSLESDHSEERRAAAMASVRLGGPGAAQHLFPLLETADDEEAADIAEALLQAPADFLVPLVVRNYEEASPAGRAVLLNILAARRAHDHIEFVIEKIRDENPDIKRAALTALETMAAPRDLPRLLDLLLNASEAAETVALQNAVVAAVTGLEDPESRIEPILQFLNRSTDREKIVFLRPLGRLGGRAALDAVAAAAGSGDVRLRSAAVSVLGQWTDASPVDILKEIVLSSGDRRVRIPALEGCVRLVNRSRWSATDRFAALKTLYDFLEKEEDGKIVVRALGSVRSPEAFRQLTEALENPVLAQETVHSLFRAIDGATPEEWWLRTHETVAAVKKARNLCVEPEDRAQAARLLEEVLASMGYRPLFNGHDLSGWRGLAADPPVAAKMSAAELKAAAGKAEEDMRNHWSVSNGILVFDGKGRNLCTERNFGDFDLLVDWKIAPGGDSGIYLRGTPQVQIWDAAANPEGSGGLYNNQRGPSKPLKPADNPVGEWNAFRIVMIGERVWVFLNDEPVVDGVLMENYWDAKKPIASFGPIELQAHGNPLWFRDIYIREIPRDRIGTVALPHAGELAEGFTVMFNGRDLTGWTGDLKGYAAENGKIVVRPEQGTGNLYTAREYADFVLRFEFKLTPTANNGLGVRAPLQGDAAYAGMEIQILDDGSPVYRNLRPYQYHGSVYGIIPAARGALRPAGEWNTQEVVMNGRRVTVILNGRIIVDADLDEAAVDGAMDGRPHPGLRNDRGHIGFLGHGSRVEFRNIRLKPLFEKEPLP
jgi:HEAT repeat protein